MTPRGCEKPPGPTACPSGEERNAGGRAPLVTTPGTKRAGLPRRRGARRARLRERIGAAEAQCRNAEDKCDDTEDNRDDAEVEDGHSAKTGAKPSRQGG
jgi:hypothetical protein